MYENRTEYKPDGHSPKIDRVVTDLDQRPDLIFIAGRPTILKKIMPESPYRLQGYRMDQDIKVDNIKSDYVTVFIAHPTSDLYDDTTERLNDYASQVSEAISIPVYLKPGSTFAEQRKNMEGHRVADIRFDADRGLTQIPEIFAQDLLFTETQKLVRSAERQSHPEGRTEKLADVTEEQVRIQFWRDLVVKIYPNSILALQAFHEYMNKPGEYPDLYHMRRFGKAGLDKIRADYAEFGEVAPTLITGEDELELMSKFFQRGLTSKDSPKKPASTPKTILGLKLPWQS